MDHYLSIFGCLDVRHKSTDAGVGEGSQFRGAKYPTRIFFYGKKLNPI